jgi:hypothetical protein
MREHVGTFEKGSGSKVETLCMIMNTLPQHINGKFVMHGACMGFLKDVVGSLTKLSPAQSHLD